MKNKILIAVKFVLAFLLFTPLIVAAKDIPAAKNNIDAAITELGNVQQKIAQQIVELTELQNDGGLEAIKTADGYYKIANAVVLAFSVSQVPKNKWLELTPEMFDVTIEDPSKF